MSSNAAQRTDGGAPSPPSVLGQLELVPAAAVVGLERLDEAGRQASRCPGRRSRAPSRSPAANAGVHVAWRTSSRPSSAARADSSSMPSNGPLPSTLDWISSTSNRLKVDVAEVRAVVLDRGHAGTIANLNPVGCGTSGGLVNVNANVRDVDVGLTVYIYVYDDRDPASSRGAGRVREVQRARQRLPERRDLERVIVLPARRRADHPADVDRVAVRRNAGGGQHLVGLDARRGHRVRAVDRVAAGRPGRAGGDGQGDGLAGAVAGVDQRDRRPRDPGAHRPGVAAVAAGLATRQPERERAGRVDRERQRGERRVAARGDLDARLGGAVASTPLAPVSSNWRSYVPAGSPELWPIPVEHENTSLVPPSNARLCASTVTVCPPILSQASGWAFASVSDHASVNVPSGTSASMIGLASGSRRRSRSGDDHEAPQP